MGRRAARRDAGVFVVEGPKLVAEALSSGLVVPRVFVEEGYPIPDASPDAAVVAPGVLGRVLDTVTPQPVAAVVESPPHDLDDVLASPGLVLVGDRVGDPGNVGTIVRSLEAFGGGGLVLLDGSADAFGPKAVRSSAGSVLRVPVVEGVAAAELLDACGRRGRQVLATVMSGGDAPNGARLRAAAVVLGSEAHGVSTPLLEGADGLVSIPMAGPTESLNVAMAATVLAYQSAAHPSGTGRE